MYLKRNYVQPQCSPTRVGFLTGRYPYRFGLHEHIVLGSSTSGIPGETKTIAEKMKEAGYRTAIVGKWHVGGRRQSFLPHNQGFDYSFACIGGGMSYWNYTSGGKSEIIRNGEKYYAPSLQEGEESGNTYATDLWKEEAVTVIRKHDQKDPLFMYLSFTAPHYPLHAPQKLIEKYDDIEIDPYWSGPDARYKRNAKNRQIYMALVDAMDSAIGEVMDALENQGMLENTLIVFCSDNGGIPDADNRPFRSYKGDSFEGGVRVPGIVYWPGQVTAGSSSSELIYVADWYSTFSEIAGLNTESEKLDGVSALEILKGGKGNRSAVPIISARRHAYIQKDYSLVGSGEDYQLLADQNLSAFQLFELNGDVSQETEITAKVPEAADSMRKSLKTHLEQVNRGYFNWAISYAKYREEKTSSNHHLDSAINDVPKLSIKKNKVTISPVSKGIVYTLQGHRDGAGWVDLDVYPCKKEAKSYTFARTGEWNSITEYRVRTDYSYGLPTWDTFLTSGKYKPGPLSDSLDPVKEAALVPSMDGFLPICDMMGGNNIRILEDSLAYKDRPQEGGSMQLKSSGKTRETSITRYFVDPHSRGKIAASMLVQFKGGEAECLGEINWLRQNGWNGTVVQPISLTLEWDGIYLNHTDTVSRYPRTRVADYDQEVVCVVFEYDFSTTGQDVLNVYINPEGDLEELTPNASLFGEFTFDRLQFKVSHRPGSEMLVDEIRIGRNLIEVI